MAGAAKQSFSSGGAGLNMSHMSELVLFVTE